MENINCECLELKISQFRIYFANCPNQKGPYRAPSQHCQKKSLEVGFLTSLRFENVHEITILRIFKQIQGVKKVRRHHSKGY